MILTSLRCRVISVVPPNHLIQGLFVFVRFFIKLAHVNFSSIFYKGALAATMNFTLQETHILFLFLYFYCLFNLILDMLNSSKLD